MGRGGFGNDGELRLWSSLLGVVGGDVVGAGRHGSSRLDLLLPWI